MRMFCCDVFAKDCLSTAVSNSLLKDTCTCLYLALVVCDVCLSLPVARYKMKHLLQVCKWILNKPLYSVKISEQEENVFVSFCLGADVTKVLDEVINEVCTHSL